MIVPGKAFSDFLGVLFNMKKTICLLVALVIALQLLPIVSFSEGEDESDFVFTLGNAEGDPGDEVEIALMVSSSKSTTQIILDELTYDTENLEFVDFYIDESTLIKSDDDAFDSDEIWYSPEGIINGQMCSIKFRIKDTAVPGTYQVTMHSSVRKCSSAVIAGTITVNGTVPQQDEDYVFSLGSASGLPGDEVEIDLDVSGIVDMTTIGLRDFTYDENALEFVGFTGTDTEIVNRSVGKDLSIDSEKQAVILGFSPAVIISGNICKVKFIILDGALPGDYEISLTSRVLNESTELSTDVNNGTISVAAAPVPEFSGHELILSGSIGVCFKMILPEGMDYSDSYMEMNAGGRLQTMQFANARTDTLTGKKVFTYYASSIELAEKITPTFHYFVDGVEKTVAGEAFSAEDYINYVLLPENAGTFGTKVTALVSAIADYGYYSQQYCSGVNNWTIGVDYAEVSARTAGGFESLYTSVYSALGSAYDVTKSLDGTQVSDVKFALKLGSDTTMNIRIEMEPGSGTPVVRYKGEMVAVKKISENIYQATLGNVPASQLGTMSTVMINDGTTDAQVSLSALSYVRAVLDPGKNMPTAQKNAVVALYNYHKAVLNYIGN